MSYILDALRRADAERERGAVPGLHAQNIPADTEPAARDHRPLVWAAAGAGALLVGVVAVLVVAPWRGQPAPVAAAPIAPPVQLKPSPADDALPTTAQGETPAARPGALAPAALPVEPPITRTTASRGADRAAAAVPAPLPVPVRAAPAPIAAPAVTTARIASQAAAGRVGVLATKGATAATADPSSATEHYGPPLATTAPSPAPAPNAVVRLTDLPADTRATLPKLAVGGAIYSDSASSRMLILNGQVWHEGEKPAADTVLEQIRHKSAVLNYRGLRYEIVF